MIDQEDEDLVERKKGGKTEKYCNNGSFKIKASKELTG